MEEYNRFLDVAIDMAQKAGKIQLDYFRTKNLHTVTKSNEYDVVTAADKASEQMIISTIRNLFPEHGIISEEAGSMDQDKDYRWVIDPLDGTTNFSQGLPIFSVSIALEHKGMAIVGVVFAPYLNELFYAVKDGGAFLNGQPIRCSSKNVIAEAVVATGIPYDKRVNPDNNIEELSRVAPEVRGLRRFGSAAIDLCYVAAGFFDAYWELNLNRWDVAAGMLIASEAGARYFSIRENRNHSVLMAAPGIADRMLEMLLTPCLHHDVH